LPPAERASPSPVRRLGERVFCGSLTTTIPLCSEGLIRHPRRA